MKGYTPHSPAIRWTQRFVLGALGEDASAARRTSCLILLAVFVPLGVLSSLAVRAGDFLAPTSLAGITVTVAIIWLAWTTRTDAQQHRWSWVVFLIAVDQGLGIYQLGSHGTVLLAETTMLGAWSALYLPTRIVRQSVVWMCTTITVVLLQSDNLLVSLLAVFVAQITIATSTLLVHTGILTLRATNGELDDARQLAQVLATTDVLTGAANRRSFTDLVRELASTDEGEQVLLLVDIDHFKSLNDEHGHLAGDVVLRAVAQRLAEALPDASVARWGGEEFAVLFDHHPGHPGLEECAEALRAAVAAEPVVTADGALACTVSVGATTWAVTGSFEDALRRADSALYEAKALGRNRCVTHPGGSVAPGDVRRPA
jgi:diguanylate cyclase (GGDEF)-like protein